MKKFRPQLEIIEQRINPVVPVSYYWTGDISSDWFNQDNWITALGSHGVPGANDTAHYRTGTPNCDVNSATTVGTLIVDANTSQIINLNADFSAIAVDLASGEIGTANGVTAHLYTGYMASYGTTHVYLNASSGGSFVIGGNPPNASWGAMTLGSQNDPQEIYFSGSLTFNTSDYIFYSTNFVGQNTNDIVQFSFNNASTSYSSGVHLYGDCAFTQLDYTMGIGGQYAYLNWIWVETNSSLTIDGYGLWISSNAAFIQNTNSSVYIDGSTGLGENYSLKVTGAGTDYNMCDGSSLTATGLIKFEQTGTSGDSGLLIKGNSSITADQTYFYDTKIEFQGNSYWNLSVIGGIYIADYFGLNIRCNYDSETNDRITVDGIFFDTMVSNTVTTYFTGTKKAINFKIIDTTSFYIGNFFNFQNQGGGVLNPDSGQWGTRYIVGTTDSDLYVETWLQP